MGSRVWEREQLRLTRNLVGFDSTTVTLQRRQNRTRTGAGGISGGDEWEPVVQDPDADPPRTEAQVFFGAKVQDDLPLQMNDGERVVAYYTLVAVPPLDIEERDKFVVNGVEYTVVSVHRHLDYEVKADVETYYGGHR